MDNTHNYHIEQIIKQIRQINDATLNEHKTRKTPPPRYNRKSFINFVNENYPDLDLLQKAHQVVPEKKIDEDRCFCTACTNDSGFNIMIGYWLASLILTQDTIPQIRIIYKSKLPQSIKEFATYPFIEIGRSLWKPCYVAGGVAAFNFTLKIQSVLACQQNSVTWIDADQLFYGDISKVSNETCFVKIYKNKTIHRVAGGIYTLKGRDKFIFYQKYLNKLEKRTNFNSDKTIMREVLEECSDYFDYGNIDSLSLLHLTRSAARKESYRNEYIKLLQKLFS